MGRKGPYRPEGKVPAFPMNMRYFPVPLRPAPRVRKIVGLQGVIDLRGRMEEQEGVFAYALKVAKNQNA